MCVSLTTWSTFFKWLHFSYSVFVILFELLSQRTFFSMTKIWFVYKQKRHAHWNIRILPILMSDNCLGKFFFFFSSVFFLFGLFSFLNECILRNSSIENTNTVKLSRQQSSNLKISSFLSILTSRWYEFKKRVFNQRRLSVKRIKKKKWMNN